VGELFLGGQLVIKTDQQSLKHMMNQWLSEGIQQKLLMKLLEFNYTIEYKKGVENMVANALSRRGNTAMAISSAVPTWISEIEDSYINDEYYTSLLQQWLIKDDVTPHYSVHIGILRYKGKIMKDRIR
jgi:hypothetical protein